MQGDSAGEKRPDWGTAEDNAEAEPVAKEKANFGLSGALGKDRSTGNTYKGVKLKWSEPSDARKPDAKWRFYVFKADKHIDTLHLHRQSAYLVGREKKVADMVVEHQSISKQHAVIQFRQKTTNPQPGSLSPPRRSIQPYLMDLESTNGRFPPVISTMASAVAFASIVPCRLCASYSVTPPWWSAEDGMVLKGRVEALRSSLMPRSFPIWNAG